MDLESVRNLFNCPCHHREPMSHKVHLARDCDICIQMIMDSCVRIEHQRCVQTLKAIKDGSLKMLSESDDSAQRKHLAESASTLAITISLLEIAKP